MPNPALADAVLVDNAGVYTHYDHAGECDHVEILNAHFQMHRTGNQWAVTVTTVEQSFGQLTFCLHEYEW